MSFFIRVINPNFVQGTVHVLKDGKPHKLSDPKSLDRDWFINARKAAEAKRRAEQMFSFTNPSTHFKIERK